jgi:hypothetical protein
MGKHKKDRRKRDSPSPKSYGGSFTEDDSAGGHTPPSNRHKDREWVETDRPDWLGKSPNLNYWSFSDMADHARPHSRDPQSKYGENSGSHNLPADTRRGPTRKAGPSATVSRYQSADEDVVSPAPLGSSTPYGPAPPPPPPGRTNWQRNWDLSESRESREVNFDMSRSNSEFSTRFSTRDHEELLKYKDRIRLAHAVLESEPPKRESLESELRLYEPAPKENECIFPLSYTVDKHFKEGWKAITGNQQYVKPSDNKHKLVAPANPVQAGRVKNPKCESRKKWYKVEGEEVHSLPMDRWPFKDWSIDDGFAETFKSTTPNKYSVTGDWMKEVGSILGMVNQLVFFNKAAKQIINSGFEEHVKDSGKHTWNAFTGFVQTRADTLEDITSATTSLMLNMLVRLREEVLKSCKLTTEELNLLRFAPPQGENGKLFNGVLPEFREWKAKRVQTEVLTECLRNNNNNNYKRKGNFYNQDRYNKKSKSADLESKVQSFQEQGYGKKKYTFKRRGGAWRKKGNAFHKAPRSDSHDKFNKGNEG